MPQHHKRQLKNIFINRSLQLRLVFISLGYMAIILAVTLSFTLLPVLHTMFETTDPNVKYQSAQTFILLAQRLVPAVLILFTFFFFHLVIMTHRICGPLVNIGRTLEAMAEGNFTRTIQLRRRDYLHAEAELVNEALGNLRDHVTALQEEQQALTEVLKKAEENPTPETLAEARERSEKVNELVEAFHI